MKIFVKAKPNAKAESVTSTDDLFGKKDELHLTVAVKEPPTEGRANRAIIKAVAKYLGVAPSRVQLAKGQISRNKILEIS
jgi:uncharacterized protein (TIGR00251 family)